MNYLKLSFLFAIVFSLVSCQFDELGLEQYDGNKRAGESFLSQNKENEGVVVTTSGLQYSVQQEGEGSVPRLNDIVKFKYTFSTIDGEVLGSNVESNSAAISFAQVSGMLMGLNEGFQLMPVGSTYTFYLPYQLAYGTSMYGGVEPYSVLIFEIELLEEGNAQTRFTDENEGAEDVQITDSGLQFKVIEQGEGAHVGKDDIVELHYHGTFIDGTVFDSSVDRGVPSTFGVSGVIPGFSEGLQLMQVGGKYEFFIPYYLAYGTEGLNGVAFATLIFEVEVLNIKN